MATKAKQAQEPEAPILDPQAQLELAICQVMKGVTSVAKSGRNQGQGYDYTTEADLVMACRSLMADLGLTLRPESIRPLGNGPVDSCSSGQDVAYQSQAGNQMWRFLAIWTWRVSHIGGGSARFETVGCGVDNSDKHPYKAGSGAKKYALEQLFLIPRVDADPELDLPDRDQPSQGRPQGSGDQGGRRQGQGPSQQGGGRARGPVCPECGGPMFDNRGPNGQGPDTRAPWFKCKNREQCGIAIWPQNQAGQPVPHFETIMRGLGQWNDTRTEPDPQGPQDGPPPHEEGDIPF